jgi:uncharacterized SAM-binding protein YcdF (DUF218 family)
LRFLQRREIWCPTWLGLFCLVALLGVALAWWFVCGESFLSPTQRLPADVLVVEGWIGDNGIRAAATEFEQRGWSYAEVAECELIRNGVPKDRIIVAATGSAETQRTFESACAVRRVFQAREIHPGALNVFTWGSHARRSQLVFAKVLQPGMKVAP